MTTPAFALIGRSFPSEDFERLHLASLQARARRRAAAHRPDADPFGGPGDPRAPHRWRGSRDAVLPSPRLKR